MSIELFGYSERGMINAISYEIRHSPRGVQLLTDFLMLCEFPFENPRPDFRAVQKATIIVEQSFSEFGDLDLLLLLDDRSGAKHSVFVEAKVKTSQANFWHITDEWNGFQGHVQNPASRSTSNLFVQLYRKMRLVPASKGHCLGQDAISASWQIGGNAVVLKAMEKLAPYATNARFLALVPDSPDKVRGFFGGELVGFAPAPAILPDWSREHLGYLTWSQLEAHCLRHPEDWRHTLTNFDYNLGQIYVNGSGGGGGGGGGRGGGRGGGPPENHPIYDLHGQPVVIVGKRGPHTSRYRKIENGRVNPISLSDKAPNGDFQQQAGPSYTGPVQPRPGDHYMYNGKEVIVVTRGGGAEQSRVRWAIGGEGTFLVYNHELQLMG